MRGKVANRSLVHGRFGRESSRRGCYSVNRADPSFSLVQKIIDGLLRAFNEGADVITLSLGGSSGWSESPANVVASNIVAAGRVVTIAQGNEGSTGTFYGES